MAIDRFCGEFIFYDPAPSFDAKGHLEEDHGNSVRLTDNFQHFISAVGLVGPYATVFRTASNALVAESPMFSEYLYLLFKDLLHEFEVSARL
jgi:hypothetical protein